MKRYLLLFVLLTLVLRLPAQQLKPELICPGSGMISNGTVSLTWAIGETVIATMASSSIKLTNGAAQPDISVLSVLNNPIGGIECKLFPNPTKDILILQSSKLKQTEAEYNLFDISGKKILNSKITDDNTSIDVSNLPASVYWLNIHDGAKKIIQTYKIIKQ